VVFGLDQAPGFFLTLHFGVFELRCTMCSKLSEMNIKEQSQMTQSKSKVTFSFMGTASEYQCWRLVGGRLVSGSCFGLPVNTSAGQLQGIFCFYSYSLCTANVTPR